MSDFLNLKKEFIKFPDAGGDIENVNNLKIGNTTLSYDSEDTSTLQISWPDDQDSTSSLKISKSEINTDITLNATTLTDGSTTISNGTISCPLLTAGTVIASDIQLPVASVDNLNVSLVNAEKIISSDSDMMNIKCDNITTRSEISESTTTEYGINAGSPTSNLSLEPSLKLNDTYEYNTSDSVCSYLEQLVVTNIGSLALIPSDNVYTFDNGGDGTVYTEDTIGYQVNQDLSLNSLFSYNVNLTTADPNNIMLNLKFKPSDSEDEETLRFNISENTEVMDIDKTWLPVRYLPPPSIKGNYEWFQANDNLAGTQEDYGIPYDSSNDWNIRYDHLLTSNTRIKIETANKLYSIIFYPSEIKDLDSFYATVDGVEAGEAFLNREVLWYNRDTNGDPILRVKTQAGDDNFIIYREDSISETNSKAFNFMNITDGIYVYIEVDSSSSFSLSANNLNLVSSFAAGINASDSMSIKLDVYNFEEPVIAVYVDDKFNDYLKANMPISSITEVSILPRYATTLQINEFDILYSEASPVYDTKSIYMQSFLDNLELQDVNSSYPNISYDSSNYTATVNVTSEATRDLIGVKQNFIIPSDSTPFVWTLGLNINRQVVLSNMTSEISHNRIKIYFYAEDSELEQSAIFWFDDRNSTTTSGSYLSKLIISPWDTMNNTSVDFQSSRDLSGTSDSYYDPNSNFTLKSKDSSIVAENHSETETTETANQYIKGKFPYTLTKY